MPTATWTAQETEKAKATWAEYQKSHDVSAWKDQTAGIDPDSGRVWFGERASDIVKQLDAEGISALLYFVRVGYDWYERKGGHR
ncbi:MAG TPA: hypothetical protein VGP72_08020 [Planctomycetota bacterium]|jgi:hypothetical protein